MRQRRKFKQKKVLEVTNKPVQIKEMDCATWSEFKAYCRKLDYTVPAMITKIIKHEMRKKQLRKDRPIT